LTGLFCSFFAYPCEPFLFIIGMAIGICSLVIFQLILIIIDKERRKEIPTSMEFFQMAGNCFGFIWITPTLTLGLLSSEISEIRWGGTGITSMCILLSWISDGSAYYVGSRFGRWPAMPTVSPNKTWEGVFAELFSGCFFSLIFCWMSTLPSFAFLELPPISTSKYLILGFVMAFFGIFGDMLESLVKRLAGVKDSGIFFPGHGGILDRFDSFLFISPFYAFLVYRFL